MKKPYLIFVLLFLYSCSDDCEGVDCLSQDSFSFTIKSADTGDDLIFGNEQHISEEEIEVFYLLDGNKETALVQLRLNKIVVPLNLKVSEYFVKALNKTDTLDIRFSRRKGSGCCPNTTKIEEIKVNKEVVDEATWDFISLYR